MMKISIITATFNSEKSLCYSLDSLFNQDYKNIECIIIDGDSKDSTLGIIKKYQSNYNNIHLVSEPDQGIYDALNKGLHIASGDIIGFLHSDDILSETTIISKIVTEFNNKSIDGVYGDLCYVDKQDTSKIIRNWRSCQFEQDLLKQGWMPPHPTLFLRKEVYEKHGSFNLAYKIAADYDFMIRILKDTSLTFFYLSEIITKMRVGGASNRSLKNVLQKSKEDYRVVITNKIGGFITVLKKNTSKLKQFKLF